MKTKIALFCFLPISLFPQGSMSVDHPPVPAAIHSCLESEELKSYKIDFRINPFYLRGDFDGDGKPDFAVMILGASSQSTGLVMCQGNGKRFVLGAGSKPPFSTKRDDNFLSSDWEVVTLQEFGKLLYDQKLGSRAKGEVITLTWEDGNGYIYWDGDRYRWFEEAAGGNH